ncbi:MAG: hypothetical protein WBO17_08995 [Sphingorhabdus sp.]
MRLQLIGYLSANQLGLEFVVLDSAAPSLRTVRCPVANNTRGPGHVVAARVGMTMRQKRGPRIFDELGQVAAERRGHRIIRITLMD